MKKVYAEIVENFNGKTIEELGCFDTQEDAYKKISEIATEKYVERIEYVRVVPVAEDTEIIDFSSHKFFGRIYEKLNL